MNAIDLSTKPPREPRAQLGGVTFLPRTIDKAQAVLPGGNIGDYDMEGLSVTMLGQLEIAVDAFIAAVAEAEHEADVLAYVNENTTPEKIGAWNKWISEFVAFGGDEQQIRGMFPWFDAHQQQSLIALDLLHADDQRVFGIA